ncbi:MFS transporter [Nakamurella silvestris]|nr:MFS transporter [Nakamurella silvestris]
MTSPQSASVQADPLGSRPSVRGLLPLLRLPLLRRLVGIRILGQFGDGAFQGALAGSILFDPQKTTGSAELAAGFAILLIPYSVLGPFVGSLLDRWSRRQVIVWANILRCFFVLLVAIEIAAGAPLVVQSVTALVVLGAGRFIGSGLSAAMPHTVANDSLIGANSLVTTIGAISTTVGGAVVIGLLSLLDEGSFNTAIVTCSVILFYAGAAWVASGFSRKAIGPDETDEPAETLRAILGGLGAGWHHIRQRPTIGTAIAMVMLVRFCFGMTTLLLLLLYSSRVFGSSGLIKDGPAGIAEALGVSGIGVFIGAVATAPAVRLLGRTRWLVVVLSTAAVVSFFCAAFLNAPMTMVAAFVLAFTYQSSKICADTVVQGDSDDAHIGRVFALYDTVNNGMFVIAFVLGALLVPPNGYSPGMVVVVGIVYIVAAMVYPLAMRRSKRVTAEQLRLNSAH